MAVLDEAMVASGHDQVESTGDPTAHAVIVVLREAARRLGRIEPFGDGHLLGKRAVHDVRGRADGERRGWARLRPAQSLPMGPPAQRTLQCSRCVAPAVRIVSGIMQTEAAELTSPIAGRRN